MTEDIPSPDSSPSSRLQIIESAMDHLDRKLSPDEMNRVITGIENYIVPIADRPNKIFVLGSYYDPELGKLEEGDKWKLKGVKGTFNKLSQERGNSEICAFLMEDVPGGSEVWIDSVTKFRVIADISDCIISIAEHANGGAVFEQGMILTEEEYKEKTILMKREYGSKETEKEKFSWMQSGGLFDRFEERNRLITWEAPPELFQKTEALYEVFCEE